MVASKGSRTRSTTKAPPKKRRTSPLTADEAADRLTLLAGSFDDVAIISMDVDGKVESWNPGAEAIFDIKKRDIMGLSSDVVFTPEDIASHEPERERARAVKSGRSSDERWHMRSDGSRFLASGVTVPLYHRGLLEGFAKIARDLTLSIAAETARVEVKTLKRIVDAQEGERKRLSRDLHDQLGQQLTALRLNLEAMKLTCAAEPAMIRALDEAQEMAKRINDQITFMTWELRPSALDHLGLTKALAAFVSEWSKNYGIAAEFHTAATHRKRLAPDLEINLYRIAQEALNNVVKYARASKVDVIVEVGKAMVVLVIEDNGVGFDLKSVSSGGSKGGLGLVGMRERATLLGGTLEIETARSKGTTVIARIPVRFTERPRTSKKRSSDKPATKRGNR